MKLFKTDNIDVKSCQLYFGFSLPSEEWARRTKNLEAKYIACERAFVHYGSTMFHWLWLCYIGQWLKWFCEAGGLTWRSQVGANPIPIPTPLIWRYLGIK